MKRETVFFQGPFLSRVDVTKLTAQLARVFVVMYAGHWRTIDEIRAAVDGPCRDGVSRRLRELREPRHGGHTVLRRIRPGTFVWEYRLVPNPAADVGWLLDKVEPVQLRA